MEKRALNGYAPGKYFCKCGTCGKEFEGDKRALRCFDCAVKYIHKRIEELESALFDANLKISNPEQDDVLFIESCIPAPITTLVGCSVCRHIFVREWVPTVQGSTVCPNCGKLGPLVDVAKGGTYGVRYGQPDNPTRVDEA